MTIRMILDELTRYYAFETGATDSGVKDDVRRAELVKLWRASLALKEYREEEARWFRDNFLSEPAIAGFYGMEDLIEFWNWLEDLD